MVNKAILIGKVGNDPEVKHFENNSVVNFSLATSENYKDKNGEKQTKTEWHKIVIWGKLVEVVEKYVDKGSRLYLEGKITTRSWDDKDGNKRFTTEIVCNNMTMLGTNKVDPKRPPMNEEASESTAHHEPATSETSDLPF